MSSAHDESEKVIEEEKAFHRDRILKNLSQLLGADEIPVDDRKILVDLFVAFGGELSSLKKDESE